MGNIFLPFAAAPWPGCEARVERKPAKMGVSTTQILTMDLRLAVVLSSGLDASVHCAGSIYPTGVVLYITILRPERQF